MDEKLIQAVIDAWVVEGKAPEYHRHQQARLRKDWPMLARALDRLTKATGGTRDIRPAEKLPLNTFNVIC